MKVLDHGYIKLIEKWGSDERIIESARMSTGKGFKGWDEGDDRLLQYLWKHKHTTPFEMAGATFEVQAPIFVFREWHRHRTQSFNEMSGRYTALPNLFYLPSIERLKNSKQSSLNKQGSEAGFLHTDAECLQGQLNASYREARKAYDYLLAQGVAKEVARLVLPVSQYSKMRASANLWNWLRFLKLRLPENAQWEIRQYANALRDQLELKFPRTLELFTEHP